MRVEDLEHAVDAVVDDVVRRASRQAATRACCPTMREARSTTRCLAFRNRTLAEQSAGGCPDEQDGGADDDNRPREGRSHGWEVPESFIPPRTVAEPLNIPNGRIGKRADRSVEPAESAGSRWARSARAILPVEVRVFGPLGVPEMMLIFVVALLLFGPRKMPQIGRSLGRALGEFRRASNEFKRTIEDEVAADEMREVERDLKDLRSVGRDLSGDAPSPRPRRVVGQGRGTDVTSAVPELPENGEDSGEDLPRMTLLEHLDELRRRIFYSVAAIVVAFLGCWYFSPRDLRLARTSDPARPARKARSSPSPSSPSRSCSTSRWRCWRRSSSRRRTCSPRSGCSSDRVSTGASGDWRCRSSSSRPLFFLAGGYFGYLVAFPMVVRFLLGVGEDFRQVVTIRATSP